MARVAAEAGDDGTNVIVSNVMRRSELQVWLSPGTSPTHRSCRHGVRSDVMSDPARTNSRVRLLGAPYPKPGPGGPWAA